MPANTFPRCFASTILGATLMSAAVGVAFPVHAQRAACIDGVVVDTSKPGESDDDGSLEKALEECFPVPDEKEMEALRAAWPKSLEEAVLRIIDGLSPESRSHLKAMDRSDLIELHMGFGTGIRNDFGLWSGNDALLKSVCGDQPCHPDDASMRIIEDVWERLQEASSLIEE